MTRMRFKLCQPVRVSTLSRAIGDHRVLAPLLHWQLLARADLDEALLVRRDALRGLHLSLAAK